MRTVLRKLGDWLWSRSPNRIPETFCYVEDLHARYRELMRRFEAIEVRDGTRRLWATPKGSRGAGAAGQRVTGQGRLVSVPQCRKPQPATCMERLVDGWLLATDLCPACVRSGLPCVAAACGPCAA